MIMIIYIELYINVCVDVVSNVQAVSYLSLFAYSSLFIDSHSHGACNTLIDAIVTHTPLIIWKGNKWNNRIGAASLKRLGLMKAIVYNEREYIDSIVKLIYDDSEYNTFMADIANVNMDTLFDISEAYYWPHAFYYLYQHHEQIQHNKSKYLRLQFNTTLPS